MNLDFKGLGWLDSKVTKINSKGLRLPHVGWNKIKINRSKTKFFSNITDDQMLYFNHKYAAKEIIPNKFLIFVNKASIRKFYSSDKI